MASAGITKAAGQINSGLLDGARKRAQSLRDQARTAISSAMDQIDEEIAKHNGIYPENNGALNQRELCRRAGIHYQTLNSPAHKTTTLLEVKKWLDAKLVKTVQEAKKEVSEKADYWKEQHAIVATNISLLELELNERDVMLRTAQKEFDEAKAALDDEIKRLRAENADLRHQVAEGHRAEKITPLNRKGK